MNLIEMWTEYSDTEILRIIGAKIKQYRLNENITQSELAQRAYVSVTMIQRIETGKPVSTLNFISVLRELRHLEKLEMSFPDIPISPVLLMKLQGKQRKRASGKK